MGWSAGGSLGTATSKTAGQTLTVTAGQSVPVGAIVVVWAAWDNNNGSTTFTSLRGVPDDHCACTDSAGNVYATVAMGAQGGSNSRTLGELYIAYVNFALTSGVTTITTTMYVSKTAKAMSVEYFTPDSGCVWASQANTTVLTNGADPAAITLSGLASHDYLLLHLLSAEGPSTDTYTWDANYTQISSAGTTGGVADTNQTISGGYRMLTGTGDTVNVTALTAFRDYTQLLCAVVAVPVGAAFPTTPVLDDFNRADESPLNGSGAWDTTNPDSHGVSNFARLVSNQAATVAGSTTNAGSQYATGFGTYELEAYATLAAIPATGGHWLGVEANVAGTIATTILSNIFRDCLHTNNPSGMPHVLMVQSAGSSFNTAQCYFWQTLAAGDKIGLRVTGAGSGTTEGYSFVYLDLGAGWLLLGAALRPPVFTNAPGAGQRIGLNGIQSVVRWEDFGGGGYVAPVTQHLLPILHVGA